MDTELFTKVNDRLLFYGDRQKHVIIPDGWHIVEDGESLVQKHDRFFNLLTVQFQTVEADDLDMPSKYVSLLIRNYSEKDD